MSRITFDIDSQVKRKLKTHVAGQGLSIKEALTKAIDHILYGDTAQTDLVTAARDARAWFGDAPAGNSPHCTAKRNLCLELDAALAPFAEVNSE